jgi:acyl-CoA reductase-like NAD-dependent aldehyde dehydrogenase
MTPLMVSSKSKTDVSNPAPEKGPLEERPMILNGSDRFGRTGTIATIYNPADGVSTVGSYHRAERLHIELIEHAAENGFKAFRETTIFRRAEILERLARLLEGDFEPFAKLITMEAGKPIQLARAEVTRSIQICRSYARQALQGDPPCLPVRGYHSRLVRFPIGPVLAITPFNFPLSLVMHKLAPAIAAGCSITLKPAPQTPLSALRLGGLAIEAGFEAISVVPSENALAEALVQLPVFQKISFTGSAAVGAKIRQLAGHRSLTLELGGNAAVIIEDLSQSAEEIAERVAFGAFSYSGQICVSVQRILINEAIKEEFLPALVQAARTIKVGSPKDPDVLVGPMISMASLQRSRGIIKDALKAGANVVYGGNTFNTFTLNPTLVDRTTPTMPINTEEVFAPIATVQMYRNFEDAITLANQSRYGIQTGVYTANTQQQREAFARLETGGVLINEIPTFRADALPYGGVKESGQGREGVMAGIDEYSYQKTYLEKL